MESARRADQAGHGRWGVPSRAIAAERDPLAYDRLQARLDLATEVANVATWEHDPATDSITWSMPVERVFGHEPGTRLFRLITTQPGSAEPGDRSVVESVGDALVEPVLTALRAGAPWETYELSQTIQGPHAEYYNVLVRAIPIGPPGARRCVGVVANLTDSREAEQALRDLIDRYKVLVEFSPDAIIVHQDGLLVYGNPAAARMVSLEKIGEAFGKSIIDFLHPDCVDEVLSRLAGLDEPGAVSPSAEAVIVGLDGTTTIVEATSVRTTWEGKPAYQVIIRDITERRRAEAAMRYQASLVAHVSDAIIGINPSGRIESWNPAAQAIYGWEESEVVGRLVTEVLTAGRDSSTVLESGNRVHVRRDGRLMEAQVSLSPLMSDMGQPSGWVAVCTEVTEARRAEAGRRAAEERYAAVVSSLEEGIIVVDGTGALNAANHAAQRMLGERLETCASDDLFAGREVAIREDGLPFSAGGLPIAATLRTGQAQTNVVMGVLDENRRRKWLSVSSRLLSDSSGHAHTVVCTFADITHRKQAEAQLRWQANHDHLTGLANRNQFVERFDQALAEARVQNSNVAVLLVDLDNFQLVNDSLGHELGNEVLTSTARRLETAVRGGDLVSRLEGDEFAVLCKNVAAVDSAVKLSEALSQVLAQPLTVSGDQEVSVTVSVGVVAVEGGNGHAQDVLQDAAVAMHRAKEKGRARVEVFDEILRHRSKARLEVREDLRRGISRDELRVYYQPLASVTEDRTVGMEALVRWEHPTRGLLPPSEFIPIAEETDLILALGTWVLREACTTMADWTEMMPGARDAYITVNLSARQLADPSLTATIEEALEKSGLPPEALVLEVTESTLMADAVNAGNVLSEIRRMGVRLAIDDFGTGYSSLAHLKQFAVDFLKIDRAFIDGLGRDGDDSAIVGAVVELGHTLDLTVVAEGVETPGQLAEVRRLGCDLYQGYLLARPGPGHHITFTGKSDSRGKTIA